MNDCLPDIAHMEAAQDENSINIEYHNALKEDQILNDEWHW